MSLLRKVTRREKLSTRYDILPVVYALIEAYNAQGRGEDIGYWLGKLHTKLGEDADLNGTDAQRLDNYRNIYQGLYNHFSKRHQMGIDKALKEDILGKEAGVYKKGKNVGKPKPAKRGKAYIDPSRLIGDDALQIGEIAKEAMKNTGIQLEIKKVAHEKPRHNPKPKNKRGRPSKPPSEEEKRSPSIMFEVQELGVSPPPPDIPAAPGFGTGVSPPPPPPPGPVTVPDSSQKKKKRRRAKKTLIKKILEYKSVMLSKQELEAMDIDALEAMLESLEEQTPSPPPKKTKKQKYQEIMTDDIGIQPLYTPRSRRRLNLEEQAMKPVKRDDRNLWGWPDDDINDFPAPTDEEELEPIIKKKKPKKKTPTPEVIPVTPFGESPGFQPSIPPAGYVRPGTKRGPDRRVTKATTRQQKEIYRKIIALAKRLGTYDSYQYWYDNLLTENGPEYLAYEYDEQKRTQKLNDLYNRLKPPGEKKSPIENIPPTPFLPPLTPIPERSPGIIGPSIYPNVPIPSPTPIDENEETPDRPQTPDQEQPTIEQLHKHLKRIVTSKLAKQIYAKLFINPSFIIDGKPIPERFHTTKERRKVWNEFKGIIDLLATRINSMKKNDYDRKYLLDMFTTLTWGLVMQDHFPDYASWRIDQDIGKSPPPVTKPQRPPVKHTRRARNKRTPPPPVPTPPPIPTPPQGTSPMPPKEIIDLTGDIEQGPMNIPVEPSPATPDLTEGPMSNAEQKIADQLSIAWDRNYLFGTGKDQLMEGNPDKEERLARLKFLKKQLREYLAKIGILQREYKKQLELQGKSITFKELDKQLEDLNLGQKIDILTDMVQRATQDADAYIATLRGSPVSRASNMNTPSVQPGPSPTPPPSSPSPTPPDSVRSIHSPTPSPSPGDYSQRQIGAEPTFPENAEQKKILDAIRLINEETWLGLVGVDGTLKRYRTTAERTKALKNYWSKLQQAMGQIPDVSQARLNSPIPTMPAPVSYINRMNAARHIPGDATRSWIYRNRPRNRETRQRYNAMQPVMRLQNQLAQAQRQANERMRTRNTGAFW